jgi:hypothetical protein
MEWTNLKIMVLMELAVTFQDRELQTIISKCINPEDVRPIPELTAKCSPPIGQTKQSSASCEKLLTSLN